MKPWLLLLVLSLQGLHGHDFSSISSAITRDAAHSTTLSPAIAEELKSCNVSAPTPECVKIIAKSRGEDLEDMKCNQIYEIYHPKKVQKNVTIPEHDDEWYTVQNRQALEKFLSLLLESTSALLSGAPRVSDVLKFCMPYINLLRTKDTEQTTVIREGFQKLSTQIGLGIARINFDVVYDIVRSIEDKSHILFGRLENIFIAKPQRPSDPMFETGFNQTITDFLDECEQLNPHNMVISMSGQFAIILRLFHENDIDHTTKNLEEMEGRLNRILHKLTIIIIFQQYLQGNSLDERSNQQIQLLNVRLEQTKIIAQEEKERLLSADHYWNDIDKIVDRALEGRGDFLRQSNANFLLERLNKIHTSDRFCVTIEKEGEDYFQKGHRTQNERIVNTIGLGVHVFRSREVYKMTLRQYMNIAHNPRRTMCGKNSKSLYDLAEEMSFGFIQHEQTYGARKVCDCFMDDRDTREYMHKETCWYHGTTFGERTETREYHLIPN